MNPLPTFRITMASGREYVTSMAQGTTLVDAEQYFLRHTPKEYDDDGDYPVAVNQEGNP